MPKEVDLNWLVSGRSRVQGLSLDLLILMEARQQDIRADRKGFEATLLMVGVAFSLKASKGRER